MSDLRESLGRNVPDTLFRLPLFSFVVLVAWAAAKLIRYPVGALVRRERFGLSFLLRETLVTLSLIAAFVVGLMVALVTPGTSPGPVFGGLGVIGILVGLAAQDWLGNRAAGAMILMCRPYDLKDHIKVAATERIIKRMNLLATTVETFDDQLLVVPNRRIRGDTITNLTVSHVRRVDIKVNFTYAEDPDRVHAVPMDVLQQLRICWTSPNRRFTWSAWRIPLWRRWSGPGFAPTTAGPRCGTSTASSRSASTPRGSRYPSRSGL